MRYYKKRKISIRQINRLFHGFIIGLFIVAFVIALSLVDHETKYKCTDYYFTDEQAICK